ncbi:hypothetical protein BGX38DRAFT_1268602 [Terfezia claveryi]|nr:hypothetical protein BGX38DRAFT_1268602 [Terfezia claveryi]
MTPHSRAIVEEGLNHLEKRVIQYQVIDPVSQGLKQLRNGKKARIATASALEAGKAANREARRLAKEVKDKEVKEVPVLENAMSFMILCERTYGELIAASRGRGRPHGRGGRGGRGRRGVVEGIESLVAIAESG